MPDTRFPWLDVQFEELVTGGVPVLKKCELVDPDGSRHEMIVKGITMNAEANQPATISVELYHHRVKIREAGDAPA